jgi:phosphoglycolate phosphatase-like HAD superfamily hydrolase
MGRHGLDRADTIAIGDSVWDGKAAERAGIEFTAVRSGGTPAAQLEAVGASAVYDDPEDIRRELHRGPLARLLGP